MDLWVKALHVIAVISWMAALLYLPRLFVYHCDATWIFGLWIAALYDGWTEIWFLIKFALVLAMTVMHFVYAKHAKQFAQDSNEKSAKHFRMINEIPAVFMIGIVIMVVVKPF